MDYNTFIGEQTEYPDDIADMLVNEITELCSMGALDETMDSENSEHLKADLTECLYQIKAIAENPYNSDYWRTFYKVLSDITANGVI